MARDIADGYVQVSERTFVRMTRGQIESIGFEIERRLRDIRGEKLDLEDVKALRLRNQRLQRLMGARRILNGVRSKRKL
jgi:hypothetical protein